MERKLFLILISIVAAALGLGGCGDDPTPINREPAGEACAAGGVRIGEGDEAFFICHSSVAEEAPGENCAAGGLRVEDGEGVRYVCSALPDDEEGLRIEALPIDEALLHCGSEAIRIIQPGADEEEHILCIKRAFTYGPLVRFLESLHDAFALYTEDASCEWENEDQEEAFLDDLETSEFNYRYILVNSSCTADILSLLGVPPEGSHVEHWLECMARDTENARDCALSTTALFGGNFCPVPGSEFEAERASCMGESQGEINAFCAAKPTRDPDAEKWDERAEELAELIGCDLSLIPRE